MNPSLLITTEDVPKYRPPLNGIHDSLFVFSCRCAETGHSKDDICRYINAGIARHGTRRLVDEGEINRAIISAFNKVSSSDCSAPSPEKIHYSKFEAEEAFERWRITADDLKEESPLEVPITTEDALTQLYASDDLINMSVTEKVTHTKTLREWIGWGDLSKCEFMVPHPMTARHGTTKDGRPNRPRTTSNTGARRWVIVEFDRPPLEWQPSLIMELAQRAQQWPMMVLWSGNKSLHSWWDINDAPPDAIQLFEQEALKLGADPVFMGDSRRCQLARTPMAVRKNNGNRQSLLFWNPKGKKGDF
jgi:hypothetical protein